MKKIIINTILLVSLALSTSLSYAEDPALKILRIMNPPVSNGIQMGDVMHRTIEFETNAIYQLPKTSLPMKGENRNGIELREVVVKTSKHTDKNVYTISISYQVFASAAKPIVMQLPEEHFALIGGGKTLSVDIPAWKFWFSPLVSEGITNAKDNLQPQYKPAFIDLKSHQIKLFLFLIAFALGLIGLIYVNADKRWLPFMNGAFAQAHHNIKRLPKNQLANKNALMHLHHAFNKINGGNLFANDVDKFIATNPKFAKMASDIKAFFERSNNALFATKPIDNLQFIKDLMVLSKRLRDCERGI